MAPTAVGHAGGWDGSGPGGVWGKGLESCAGLSEEGRGGAGAAGRWGLGWEEEALELTPRRALRLLGVSWGGGKDLGRGTSTGPKWERLEGFLVPGIGGLGHEEIGN